MGQDARHRLEVKGICALSSQPFLLNTANPEVKSIKDFTERDRIALPSIKVSVQAVVLQMAVAAAFGEANYAKLDPLTVSMSPPDSTIAMLSGAGSVSSVFSVPPFQFQQLEQKNIHTVLSSFDVLGPHTFTVAWTSMRFRKENPELYAAFLDAVKEATATIVADPGGTAQNWIEESGSKLAARHGDQGRDRSPCRMDHDAGGDDEIRQIHVQGRQHQARAGLLEGLVLSGDRRPRRQLTPETLYAAPIKIPTASTMAPPSTIWKTACRNGVSIYRARI